MSVLNTNGGISSELLRRFVIVELTNCLGESLKERFKLYANSAMVLPDLVYGSSNS